MNQLTSIFISGPTIENNPNLPVFEWKKYSQKDIKHEGLPERYEFDWYKVSPDSIKYNDKDDVYKFNK